jgi:HD-like signal output (HDOD) protein
MVISLGDKYRALEGLPPFPAIATKLLRELSREDVCLKEIVNLIRADTGLASELLKVVNSAAFAVSTRIGSIHQAVSMLGFSRVRSFAVACSMKGFLNTTLRMDLVRKVWRHSLATGMICEQLSAACSTAQCLDDRAYTAGLLHNVGRLALFVTDPQKSAELLDGADSISVLDREREAFGMDHCDAGAWLAEKWGLSEETHLVIRTHHGQVNTEQFDPLVDVVRVSILVADTLGFDVTAPAHPFTLREIRSMLPRAAQYRFDPEQDEMRARITYQLDAFD